MIGSSVLSFVLLLVVSNFSQDSMVSFGMSNPNSGGLVSQNSDALLSCKQG